MSWCPMMRRSGARVTRVSLLLASTLLLLLPLLCTTTLAASASQPHSQTSHAPLPASSISSAADTPPTTAASGLPFDPSESAYVPVRTSPHPVPATFEVGQRATSLGGKLRHPSILLPPASSATPQVVDTVAVAPSAPVEQAQQTRQSEALALSSALESPLSSPPPPAPSTPARHPLSNVHETLELDGMRDQLLESKWLDNTKQSSSWSMSFLRNFPRKKADGSDGHNQLQRLGGPFNRSASNAAEEDPIGDYIAGMFFMYGVPLFFAMLCIVCWAGFCIGRCACNLCGRHATVLYTDKQVRINYVLSVLLVVIMFVCAAFGWTGNVQVSEGITSSFTAADNVAEYGHRFMGMASTAYGIVSRTSRLVEDFNTTLQSAPTEASVSGMQHCVNSSLEALDTQLAFTVALRNCTQYFTDDAAHSLALAQVTGGVAEVAQAQLDLSAALIADPASLPAGGISGQSLLQNMHTQLRSLNASLASMPSADTIEAALLLLDRVGDISATQGTAQALNELVTQFRALNSAAQIIVPLLADSGAGAGSGTGSGTGTGGDLRAFYDQLDSSLPALLPPLKTVLDLLLLGGTASQNVLFNNKLQELLDLMTAGGGAGDLPPLEQFVAVHRTFATIGEQLEAINATLPLLDERIHDFETTRGNSITPGDVWPPAPSNSLYVSLNNSLGPLDSFARQSGPILRVILAHSLPLIITHLKLLRAQIAPTLEAFPAVEAHVERVSNEADIRDVVTVDTPRALREFNASRVAEEEVGGGGVLCLLDVMNLFEAINDSLVILPDQVSQMHQRLMPPLQVQRDRSGSGGAYIEGNITRALGDIATIEQIMGGTGRPDFTVLTTALTSLNTSLSSLSPHHSFALLFHELLPLARALNDVTGVDGVAVATIDGSSTPSPTASTPAAGGDGYDGEGALWGNVARVEPQWTANPYSALSSFVDLHAAVQLVEPLSVLRGLVATLRTHLSGAGGGVSLDVFRTHVSRMATFESLLSTLPARIASLVPGASLPLPLDTMLPLQESLASLNASVYEHGASPSAQLLTGVEQLNHTLGSESGQTNRTQVEAALLHLQAALSLASSVSESGGKGVAALRTLQRNASSHDLFPVMQSFLPAAPSSSSEFDALHDALTQTDMSDVQAQHALIESLDASFTLPGVQSLLAALDHPASGSGSGSGSSSPLSLSPPEVDVLRSILRRLPSIRESFPDMDEMYAAAMRGVEAVGSVVTFTQETYDSYRKAKNDFEHTINNYDGVRLLVFNLGVLFPFVLSFFLLLAAVQHYGCPAMVAGLTFFPLFVLFMAMAAVQMPVSVALSDHCYNSTGEIKIQTEGRVYEKDQFQFFGLQHDIDVPSVMDYFTECIGEAPEFLVRLRDPLAVLRDQGIESQLMQSQARESIALDFAPPLQEHMDSYTQLQDETVTLFDNAVSSLNCTATNELFRQSMDAVCTDFGPAFALTTCVFLLTAICMLPGICLGVTSYKRFDPRFRDTAYARAPSSADDVHVIADQSLPEGWN